MSVAYILLLLTLVVAGPWNINFDLENKNLYKSINIALNAPCKNIKSNKTLLYVNYNKKSRKTHFYFNDFASEILKDSQYVSGKVFFHHQKIFFKFWHKELMLFADIQAFHYFYARIYNRGNMDLSYTTMFIASITTFDTTTLELLFRDLFHMSVLNIALILQLSDGNIIMVTYFPFSPGACRSMKPVIINSYNASLQRWQHSKYFPSKLDSFHGCPLKCAIWPLMPYLRIEFVNNSKSVAKYEGFEGKLLEFMAQQMNFTSDVYIMKDEEESGACAQKDINVGKILLNQTDFAVGAFYYNPSLTLLPYTQTMNYYLSSIYIVANLASSYSHYEKLAYPFQTSVWMAIGFVLLLGALIIFTLSSSKRCRKQRGFIIGAENQTPYYHLCTLAMGATMVPTALPRHNFARFLFISWMLVTLVMRSAYQSGMYQMLRENRQRNPPQTIADVIQQKYEFLNVGNRSKCPDITSVTDVRTISEATTQHFKQMAKSGKRMAMVTPYEHFGYLHKTDLDTWKHLYLVKERIFTQPMVINVHPNSYLVHNLNDQITRAQYFGFIQLWERDYFGTRTRADSYLEAEIKTNVLSMNELGALFLIMMWLHLLACVVLAVEIVWHKRKSRPKDILQRNVWPLKHLCKKQLKAERRKAKKRGEKLTTSTFI